jgi:hypothetical protein
VKCLQGRVKGRTIKWSSKSEGREQLSIQWELGIRDDGYVPGALYKSDISPEISNQKYRTCTRLYFEGQVPE